MIILRSVKKGTLIPNDIGIRAWDIYKSLARASSASIQRELKVSMQIESKQQFGKIRATQCASACVATRARVRKCMCALCLVVLGVKAIFLFQSSVWFIKGRRGGKLPLVFMAGAALDSGAMFAWTESFGYVVPVEDCLDLWGPSGRSSLFCWCSKDCILELVPSSPFICMASTP